MNKIESATPAIMQSVPLITAPAQLRNTLLTIEEMHDIASSRGGKCLSTVYVNNKSPLLWKCSIDTHRAWWANSGNVKNHGSWCPECIINIGEELTRATLQEAFPGRLFIRTRGEPWLGGKELDAFCKSEGLAAEYQGIQHSENDPFFHRTETSFAEQTARDDFKRDQCMLHDVVLLQIPHTIPYKNIRAYIRRQLVIECGYFEEDLAPVRLSDTEFFDQIRSSSTRATIQFERAKEIIERKGGICISTCYVGYRVPLTIQCEKGHIFSATLESISREDDGPRFCNICAGTQPITEEQCEQLAIKRGYNYLGRSRCADITNPNKSRWRLVLKCKNDHIWYPSWENFKSGKNCKECSISATPGGSARRLTDACVDARVSKRGLVLLDPKYLNNSHVHTWSCKAGHVFQDTYITIEARSLETACMICEFNTHGAVFGLQLMPQPVYGQRLKSSWPWQCSLCPLQNIIATKKQVTVNNFKNCCKRGDILLGRSNIHLCPNAPPQPPRIPTRVKKATILLSSKSQEGNSWAKNGELSLVNPLFTDTKDKKLQWCCNRGHHTFEGSYGAVTKRAIACFVCEFNAEEVHYGLRVTPQTLYCHDKELWPRECLLCGVQGIIAPISKMSAGKNHAANERRGSCHFGRALAHKCPLPHGRPKFAPRIWLLVGRALGLPDNVVRSIVWLLVGSCLR